jgi:hypothetical protein
MLPRKIARPRRGRAIADQLDGDLPHDIIGLDAGLTAIVTGGAPRRSHAIPSTASSIRGSRLRG